MPATSATTPATPWQRLARIRAVQALCILDAGDVELLERVPAFLSEEFEELERPAETAAADVNALAERLIRGSWAEREMADARFGPHLRNWSAVRIGAVERAILRLALHEMYGEYAGEKRPAAKVFINEAIELARYFVSEDAAAFVNGVLDAVYKSVPENAETRLPAASG